MRLCQTALLYARGLADVSVNLSLSGERKPMRHTEKCATETRSNGAIR